jgi:AraC-like DNA-binding protein
MTRCAEQTLSMRAARSFLRVLKGRCGPSRETLEQIESCDPDSRLPVHVARELLERAVAYTGDEALGLRAALRCGRGELDLLEFVAASSATYRDCISVLRRYIRLLNDALDVHLVIRGGVAIAQLDWSYRPGRTLIDFVVASLYLGFARRARFDPSPFRLETCFSYKEPPDTRLHRRIFRVGHLRFTAPFDGFILDERLLDRPIASADPGLNELLRRLADERLAELPEAAALTQRVRVLVSRELSGGNPSAAHVAERLGMSRRTLTRRLKEEGTSFKVIIDDLRRGLAQRYLVIEGLGVSEIAAMLGFSDAAAFHRAFRRWCGQSPAQYRKSHHLVGVRDTPRAR